MCGWQGPWYLSHHLLGRIPHPLPGRISYPLPIACTPAGSRVRTGIQALECGMGTAQPGRLTVCRQGLSWWGILQGSRLAPQPWCLKLLLHRDEPLGAAHSCVGTTASPSAPRNLCQVMGWNEDTDRQPKSCSVSQVGFVQTEWLGT